MKYIFIDTNNYISCALMLKEKHCPETIDELSEVLSSKKVILLLPEIVEIEFFRKIDLIYREIENAVNELVKILKEKFPSYLNKDKGDFIRSAEDILKNRKAAKTRAISKIKSLFENSYVIRIPLNSEIFINAFRRASAGKKPYKGKERNNIIDNDCIIFESINFKLREFKEKTHLIFCSDNTEDFAENNVKMKSPQLSKDLIDDLPNGTSIIYYRHFANAIKVEFSANIPKTNLKEIEKISDSIRASVGLFGTGIQDAENISKAVQQAFLGLQGQTMQSQKNLNMTLNELGRSYGLAMENYVKQLNAAGNYGIMKQLEENERKMKGG
jgi:hypothetical protein